uniref:Uncharacterized protein n=1 Tax=Steinernema glaseri TaxID=37863 RepID=A0A1I7ZXS1_9BILA
MAGGVDLSAVKGMLELYVITAPLDRSHAAQPVPRNQSPTSLIIVAVGTTKPDSLRKACLTTRRRRRSLPTGPFAHRCLPSGRLLAPLRGREWKHAARKLVIQATPPIFVVRGRSDPGGDGPPKE